MKWMLNPKKGPDQPKYIYQDPGIQFGSILVLAFILYLINALNIFPLGFIWTPSQDAIWMIPLNILLIGVAFTGIISNKNRGKLLNIFYIITVLWNILSIISQITYVTLPISLNDQNNIWLFLSGFSAASVIYEFRSKLFFPKKWLK